MNKSVYNIWACVYTNQGPWTSSKTSSTACVPRPLPQVPSSKQCPHHAAIMQAYENAKNERKCPGKGNRSEIKWKMNELKEWSNEYQKQELIVHNNIEQV